MKIGKTETRVLFAGSVNININRDDVVVETYGYSFADLWQLLRRSVKALGNAYGKLLRRDGPQ